MSQFVQSEASNPFVDQRRLLNGVDKPTVIDGGAHVGTTAVEYLKQFPGARIFSFEPFQESIEGFKRNIRATSVELIPMALSDRSCERTLYINGYSPTNSLLPRPQSGKRYYPENAAMVGESTIRCTSIDEFIEGRGLDKVHILKLDVQGAELLALQGAKNALRSQMFRLIFAELSFVQLYDAGALYYDVSSFLADYDYTLYRMYDFAYADDGQVRFCNALYICADIRMNM